MSHFLRPGRKKRKAKSGQCWKPKPNVHVKTNVNANWTDRWVTVTRKTEFVGTTKLLKRKEDACTFTAWKRLFPYRQQIHAVWDFPTLWATNDKRDVMHKHHLASSVTTQQRGGKSRAFSWRYPGGPIWIWIIRVLCSLKAKTERGWRNYIRWLLITNGTVQNQITICIKKMSQLHLGGFRVVKTLCVDMGLTEGRKRISHPVTTGNLQTLRARSPL